MSQVCRKKKIKRLKFSVKFKNAEVSLIKKLKKAQYFSIILLLEVSNIEKISNFMKARGLRLCTPPGWSCQQKMSRRVGSGQWL
jgi:hypothetical protein